MSFDAAAYRDSSLEGWEASAPGWVARQEQISRWAAPVAHWMVQAIDPQPGQRVLELAAGLGETGMLAAELVAPVGSVLITDQTEQMLDGARQRAQRLGLANVELEVINAEWIDLPLASVDAVLCRWGYMLMADAGAALAETRRVLRPGGRLAMAVWDTIEANPWADLPNRVLTEHGHGFAAVAPTTVPAGLPPAPRPGPFALGDERLVRAVLEQAGFLEPRIEAIEIVRRHESFEDLWEFQLDVAQSFHEAVMSLPQSEIESVRAELEERMAQFADASGAIEIPGRTLVALAEA